MVDLIANLDAAEEKKKSREDCQRLATMISPLWFVPDDRELASAIVACLKEKFAPHRDRLLRDVEPLFEALLSECLDESQLRTWIKNDNNKAAFVDYWRCL